MTKKLKNKQLAKKEKQKERPIIVKIPIYPLEVSDWLNYLTLLCDRFSSLERHNRATLASSWIFLLSIGSFIAVFVVGLFTTGNLSFDELISFGIWIILLIFIWFGIITYFFKKTIDEQQECTYAFQKIVDLILFGVLRDSNSIMNYYNDVIQELKEKGNSIIQRTSLFEELQKDIRKHSKLRIPPER